MTTNTFTHNNTTYDLVTIDFETYYDKDYTLRKMSTTLYICDPRFKIHGASIIQNGQNTYFYTLDTLKLHLETIDWSKTALLAHNTAFDGLILFRYFNIVPAFYLDTLSMTRPLLQNRLKSLGLDSIAKYYKIGGKLPGLEDTKGKVKLTTKEAVRLGLYCKNDTDMTIKIFDQMLPYFTEQELQVIHLTIKMYAHPRLEIDRKIIDEEIKRILKEKSEMFEKAKKVFPPEYAKLDVKKVLRSSEMLATTLRHNGIEPPKKISPTTNKETYAFARSDLNFQALQDNPNPAGNLLYNSRIVAKSDTALNKALLLKQFDEYKCCPALLNYSKTQTGRWSGGDKIQLQNLPRNGNARLSILAPKGHYLLVSDLSQIELRMAAWFSGQEDVIKVFESGRDVYKDMATKIYNIPYEDVTKDQRMVAKVTVLGLGYGCGLNKFSDMLSAGLMGPKLDLHINEVARIHSVYRESNTMIVQAWRNAGEWLYSLVKGLGAGDQHYKGLTFTEEKVIMPGNNLPLSYANMSVDEDSNFKFQGTNEVPRRIYSSLFFENIIQALSRNVIAEQMVEAAKHYDVMFCVHDELILAVPEDEIEEAEQKILQIMRTSPAWCSDLKLDAEAGYAREYSK